jgi:uncharacterized protein (TIGR00369 family)
MQDNNTENQSLQGGMGLITRYHPLHELLGMTVEPLDNDSFCLKFAMRDDLCGYPGGGILYGGVIAAVIDIIGGVTVSWSRIKDVKEQPLQEQVKRLKNIGTVDLRVDYLRPGKGKEFTVTSSIIRTGKSIVVTRMELHNEEQRLIAVGTGTYMVS